MAHTPQQTQERADDRTVHVALEVSKTSWTLAFSDGSARRPRVVGVAARDWRRIAGLRSGFSRRCEAQLR